MTSVYEPHNGKVSVSNSALDDITKQRIEKISSPEKCEIMARNCSDRGRDDLANLARLRAIQLRAERHNPNSEVERLSLQALYAYQEVLHVKHGKRVQANRTWPMIERQGVLPAVERSVNRKRKTLGYEALEEMGLSDLALEAVVLRYPDSFSANTLKKARERLGANEVKK